MADTARQAAPLQFREVTPERWPDFARLFESRGGPKYCWCMVYRVDPEEAKHTDGASRRAAMERRVRAGTPVGLLGYDGDEPVAWCSIAPRETFPRIGVASDEPSGYVWSLTCFFVSRAYRKQGAMRQLLAAAVEHVRADAAGVLEAYPVDPDSPSYRFMGFVPVFEQAGFEHAGRVGSRRHVMRLALR